MGVVALVRVASASAVADVGTTSTERRTTARGGRTFHDDGSCGGFAPLAGTGGAAPRPEDRDGPTGDHGACPARVVDRRTASPTAGAPTPAREPARPVAGAPARQDGPESDGRPPAPPLAPLAPVSAEAKVVPVGAGVAVTAVDAPVPPVALPVLDVPMVALIPVAAGLGARLPAPDVSVAVDGPVDLLGVRADGDPARRRTGDAAERIDAPAADAPPAAATTVGDMSRNACPGPASRRCCSPPASPLAGLPTEAEVRLSGPVPTGFAAYGAPAPAGFAAYGERAPAEFAVFRGPAPAAVAAFPGPVRAG